MLRSSVVFVSVGQGESGVGRERDRRELHVQRGTKGVKYYTVDPRHV